MFLRGQGHRRLRDAALVFTVSNNTGVDMMFGDVDSFAYVNGAVRDVRMRQPVAAGEETAPCSPCGHLRRSDFDVNNDLNDIYLNIWMFEEATATFTLGLVHIHRRRYDALAKQGIHTKRGRPTGSPLVFMRQLSAQCLLDHQVDQLARHADG
ncbi:MAG: hypothetical protein ACLU37_06475 [Collinsella sp.]